VATILIVDDHPSFRATARAILEADGFEIVGEAEDGTSGANGYTPTIVLTSSRDAADFGPLVGACGARGFVPKAELSGAALHAVLR
jgi:hypothetical protein